jgi:hypothetical protein
MKVLETDNWCLLLPPEWQAEQEDDVVVIVDNDGVGELSLTTLCKHDGTVAEDELLAMAREESPEISSWQAITLGAFSGVTGSFLEDNAYIREWYVAADNILIYITYLCDDDNATMDDAAIDELLGTLVLGDRDAG